VTDGLNAAHRRAQLAHSEPAQVDRLEELGGAQSSHLGRLAVGVQRAGKKLRGGGKIVSARLGQRVGRRENVEPVLGRDELVGDRLVLGLNDARDGLIEGVRQLAHFIGDLREVALWENGVNLADPLGEVHSGLIGFTKGITNLAQAAHNELSHHDPAQRVPAYLSILCDV